MDGSESIKFAGIEVLAEERTPLIDHLLRVIEELRAENRQLRDAVWKYYQRLRAYRELPTSRRKAGLERDFDRLFTRRTGFADLNEALRRIHEKRDDLLLVLEHPEIPLHNNLVAG